MSASQLKLTEAAEKCRHLRRNIFPTQEKTCCLWVSKLYVKVRVSGWCSRRFLVRPRYYPYHINFTIVPEILSQVPPCHLAGFTTCLDGKERPWKTIFTGSRHHPPLLFTGAGSFFVSKKDGILRPCIDYRELYEITIQNKYPLLLISSAFEPITIFTKVNL